MDGRQMVCGEYVPSTGHSHDDMRKCCPACGQGCECVMAVTSLVCNMAACVSAGCVVCVRTWLRGLEYLKQRCSKLFHVQRD